MKVSIHKNSFILSSTILLLMLQSVLQDYVSIIQIFDELFVVVCFVLLFINFRGAIDRCLLKMFLFAFSITIIGLIGNEVSKIQTNNIAIFTDIITSFKGFFSFFLVFCLLKNEDSEYLLKTTIKYLDKCCKLLIIPGIVLAGVNLFADIGMHTDYVYGIRSFHYIFSRVGTLNIVCVEILIIFTLRLRELQGRKYVGQMICIMITLCLMISTLRTRAVLYLIVYVFLFFYFIKGKKLKIRMRYILPLSAVALYIAFPKLQYYFLDSDKRARSVLLRNGFKLARSYWPIGTGLGTYGTFAAKKYWSPLYDKLNFNSYYGLSESKGMFLTDNYWPAIMAEFGFIGLLLMIGLLVYTIYIILRYTRNLHNSRCAALFGISCMSISSMVSSSFFGSNAVVVMMLIAIATVYKSSYE